MQSERRRIWRLFIDADRYISFIPHDLHYFTDRFCCRSLINGWEPPPVTINGRSKPLADFVSWMNRAPIVSERTMKLIENLVGSDVEFLPFHKLKNKGYYAMNVLRCEDLIDYEKSVLDPLLERIYFIENLPDVLPPIFKCGDKFGDIFVTFPFIDMMLNNKMTGAKLAYPEENIVKLILAGAEIDRYTLNCHVSPDRDLPT